MQTPFLRTAEGIIRLIASAVFLSVLNEILSSTESIGLSGF